MVGPFFDYYIDPHWGFHLGALAGVGQVVTSYPVGDAVNLKGSRRGFGVGLGLGDEWWVEEQWSLNVSLLVISIAIVAAWLMVTEHGRDNLARTFAREARARAWADAACDAVREVRGGHVGGGSPCRSSSIPTRPWPSK